MRTTLIKYILALALCTLAGIQAHAVSRHTCTEYNQMRTDTTRTGIEGDNIENPIFLGTFDKGFSKMHRFDMSLFSDTYQGRKTKDVFLSFELKAKFSFVSTATLMGKTDSVAYTLFNSKKEVLTRFIRPGSSGLLGRLIDPGFYYLVCEAGEKEGILTMNTRGTVYNDPEKPVEPENYIPTQDLNYIITITPTIASNLDTAFTHLKNAGHQIRYYDNLGRPAQEIAYKASPTRKDIATNHEYDELGRDGRQWLPVARANGAAGTIINQDDIASSAKTQYQDDCTYSYPVYESSPLNRIAQQYGPGKAWQSTGHSTKTGYNINTPEDHCLNLVAEGTNLSPIFRQCGMYPARELEVVSKKDEDGQTSYSFTDKQGHTVLQRNLADNDTLDTYYVYNDYGNLCFVLPPIATDSLTSTPQTILDKYAYQYRYDYRNRCTGKKLPGCDWIESIYDYSDRTIFTQDGEQRKRKEWSVSLSDLLDRSVLTGIYKGQPDRKYYEQQQVYAEFTSNNATDCYGYTTHGIVIDSIETLNVNYYDTYDYKHCNSGFPASLNYAEDTIYGKRYGNDEELISCKGLPTGSITTILKNGQKLYSTTYYDFNQRPVQVHSTTINGTTTVVKSALDFTGKVTDSREEYSDSIALCKHYSYDHAGRLKEEIQSLNSLDSIRFTYTYDEFGRMKSLTHNDGKHSLTTTNSYNIRNWLTAIKSPQFRQTLHYTDGNGTPCFNGNISSMTWSTDSLAIRGYIFTYDGRSRLKNAVYGEGNELTQNVNRFNEQITGYDKLGNILGLKRYGQTAENKYELIDNLKMNYNGSQLQAVKDNAVSSVYGNGFDFKDNENKAIEYEYDTNGNLKKDLNKKITDIQYNYLNLPSRILFEDGSTISYLYSADGAKRRITRVIGAKTTTTDYCGNAIYENGVLRKLLTGQGYITIADTMYHHYLQDHQENNRVIIAQNGAVEEINHYYPFGGVFATSSSVQPNKYNGKELDRSQGLDWYDYGARMYDAALGKWHAADPSSEKFYSSSPYNYCLDNPIKHVDPDGTQPRSVKPPVRRGYRNGGRPNPYALYPGGTKPQSYTQTSNFSYKGNGLRKTVAMEPQSILQTVNTPGGNEVQMSRNNKSGMWISGGIDFLNSYKDFKELIFTIVKTVKYNENGTIQKNVELVINDPALALKQVEYEANAREIEKSLGELDYTGKTLEEMINMAIERKNMIQEKLGLSPKDILYNELFTNPERFQSRQQVRRILPEFRQN